MLVDWLALTTTPGRTWERCLRWKRSGTKRRRVCCCTRISALYHVLLTGNSQESRSYTNNSESMWIWRTSVHGKGWGPILHPWLALHWKAGKLSMVFTFVWSQGEHRIGGNINTKKSLIVKNLKAHGYFCWWPGVNNQVLNYNFVRWSSSNMCEDRRLSHCRCSFMGGFSTWRLGHVILTMFAFCLSKTIKQTCEAFIP